MAHVIKKIWLIQSRTVKQSDVILTFIFSCTLKHILAIKTEKQIKVPMSHNGHTRPLENWFGSSVSEHCWMKPLELAFSKSNRAVGLVQKGQKKNQQKLRRNKHLDQGRRCKAGLWLRARWPPGTGRFPALRRERICLWPREARALPQPWTSASARKPLLPCARQRAPSAGDEAQHTEAASRHRACHTYAMSNHRPPLVVHKWKPPVGTVFLKMKEFLKEKVFLFKVYEVTGRVFCVWGEVSQQRSNV